MSNMYDWVGYSWNPLIGECPHRCSYCYVNDLVRRFPKLKGRYTGELRLDYNTLNKPLPRNKTIFVCSMNDLFAKEVPEEFIKKILEVAQQNSTDRRFLFQTKNPSRFRDFMWDFPDGSILATTIETNRDYGYSKAPKPVERYSSIMDLIDWLIIFEFFLFDIMISIEPIMDFDPPVLLKWITDIKPDFVSIGADSKHNNLPEPSWGKVQELINALEEQKIKVLTKSNLKRLKG